MSILGEIIGLLITMGLFSIALSKENDNIAEENPSKIVFEYSKSIKNVMLICAIFMFAGCLFFAIMSIVSKENYFGQQILLFVMTIFSLLLYIILTKEKIIFDNNKFYSYNILGKEKIHDIKDIIKVEVQESKGIMIVFKDRSNLKFSQNFMINYSKINDILAKSDYYQSENKM